MFNNPICFASDNFTGVHPSIMEALIQANQGHAPAYGNDLYTLQLESLFHSLFPGTPKALLVPTGTGANVLALKLACKRYESILCTEIAHIHTQETGACESLIGCKLITLPHILGKVTPDQLIKSLRKERSFGKHSTSPRVLFITQPTEIGTVYTLKELKTLSSFCKEEGLFLHMDGSRLYNAAVYLKTSLEEIIKEASVDILSLGGTKNGLLCGESVLIFNPLLLEGADYVHKQTLGLQSKMRYLSAQYLALFKEELWHSLAFHANQQAQKIATLIQNTPPLSLTYPVETNQIFFTAPPSWIPLIQEKVLCYLWDQTTNTVRFVTSWNTQEEEIEGLRLLFQQLIKDQKA